MGKGSLMPAAMSPAHSASGSPSWAKEVVTLGVTPVALLLGGHVSRGWISRAAEHSNEDREAIDQDGLIKPVRPTGTRPDTLKATACGHPNTNRDSLRRA